MELKELYNDAYYKTHADRGYREVYSMFAVWLRDRFQPKRVLDIGCGAGFLLHGFHDLGIEAIGIEGAADAFRHIPLCCPAVKMDIDDFVRNPTMLGTFDLVCSVEVIEHLRPSLTLPFFKALKTVAPNVFLTAAQDGDETVGHINVRTLDKWIEFAEFEGMNYQPLATHNFQVACHKSGQRVAKMRAKNAMIFTTKEER